MEIRPIHTEEDYNAALADVEQYFVNAPTRGTPEGDRFEILLALIGNYEQKHWAIEPPANPVEAINVIMQDRGLEQKDLAELLGSRSRASELLSYKRPLSLDQAQKLYREWRVPAECLLASYTLTQASGLASRTTARRRTARKKAAVKGKRGVKAPARKRSPKAPSKSPRKQAAKSATRTKRKSGLSVRKTEPKRSRRRRAARTAIPEGIPARRGVGD